MSFGIIAATAVTAGAGMVAANKQSKAAKVRPLRSTSPQDSGDEFQQCYRRTRPADRPR
jgi:hypothetical protein